jgi:hypothetical protein
MAGKSLRAGILRQVGVAALLALALVAVAPSTAHASKACSYYGNPWGEGAFPHIDHLRAEHMKCGYAQQLADDIARRYHRKHKLPDYVRAVAWEPRYRCTYTEHHAKGHPDWRYLKANCKHKRRVMTAHLSA